MSYWINMSDNDDSCCPNCGDGDYTTKNGCDKCGFVKPDIKSLSGGALIYCNLCGCTYLNDQPECKTHGSEGIEQVKV